MAGLIIKSDPLSLLRNVNMQLEGDTKVVILVKSIRFASLDQSCNKILCQELLLAVYVNVHVCQRNTVTPFSICDIQYSGYDK